jgi:hypothetical protein
MKQITKSYPQCYALLRRRGHSAVKAITIVLDAQRGDEWSRKWIAAMRRCEVREREQADYDLSRRCL